MTMTKNPFKSSTGNYLTKELFVEYASNKEGSLYTLKTEPHLGKPSIYQAYMAADDVTEYKFATTSLGGWEHWEILQEAPFFKPLVMKWRRELEIRQKSEALARIIEKSKSTSKESFQASKYIADNWKGPMPKRGRPSKEEISANAKAIVSDRARLEEDFARLSQLQ